MAVYNPRLDMSRQVGASPQVQNLRSVLAQQAEQVQGGVRRRDMFAQSAAEARQPELGGWKGFLTDVLESPFGKVVTKAGEIISVPNRFIVSGVREIVDALDGDENTNASWGDLTRQTLDPTFGFGKAFVSPTGNKWVDRIIGFAGDVALDPLTYVTLGAGKISKGMQVLDEAGNVVKGAKGISIAGKEGRLALSKRLLEVGAPDEVAVAAARYGRRAVKDADLLAKAGVNRAGVYFMGRRVAGTTRIGEGLERGLVTMRTWSGDHLFKRASELFDPRDVAAARRALARGTVDTENGVDFLHMVVSRNTERAAEGAAKREAQLLQRQLLGAISENDLRNTRRTAYKLLDMAGPEALQQASAEARVAGPVRDFLQQLIDGIEGAAKAVDEAAPVGRVTNYFPHLPTDNAYRFMSNTENPTAVKLQSLLYNPLTDEGSYRARMVAGDEFFGYTLKQSDIDGGIDRLNEIATQYGKIKFDFFEKDLPTVLDRYIDMYAAQMGKIARKKYLVDKGVFKRLEERLLVNDDAVKAAKEALKSAIKARKTTMTQSAKNLDSLNKQLDTMLGARVTNIADEIAGMTDEAKRVLANSSSSRQAVFTAQRTLGTLIDDLTLHQDSLAKLVGERPAILESLESEYTRIIDDLKELQEQAGEIMQLRGDVRGRLDDAKKRLEKLEKAQDKLVEFGDVVQSRWDDIMSGADLPNAKQFSENLRKALTGDVRVEGGREARMFGDYARPADQKLWDDITEKVKAGRTGGAKGKMTPEKETLIAQRYEAAGGTWSGVENVGVVGQRWWMEANRSAPISATTVAAMMNPDTLVSTIYRGIRDEASLAELRTAAMAVLALNDQNVLSPAVADELKAILVEAADVDDFYRKLSRATTDKYGRMRLEMLIDNYDRVETKVTDAIYEFAAAAKLRNQIFSTDSFDSTMVVPRDLLNELLRNPEYQALSKYFSTGDSIEDIAGMTQAFDAAGMDAATISELSPTMSIREGGEATKTSVLGGGESVDQAASGIVIGDDNMTFGDFAAALDTIVNDAQARQFDVAVPVFGKFGKETGSETVKTIKMEDVLGISRFWEGTVDEVAAKLRRGEMTLDEVSQFVEDAVTGKAGAKAVTAAGEPAPKFLTADTIAKLKPVQDLRGMNKRVASLTRLLNNRKVDERMVKWLSGAADAAPYASMGRDLDAVQNVIQGRLAAITKRLRNVPEAEWSDVDRLALDNLTAASRQIDDASRAIKGEIPFRPSRKQRFEGVARMNAPLVEDDSLRAQMEAVREQLYEEYGIDRRGTMASIGGGDVARAVGDVQMGRGGKKGIATAKQTVKKRVVRAGQEEIRARLSNALMEGWFRSEVQTRFARLSDTLFKEGLIPDADLFRKVVNMVATQHGDVLAADALVYGAAKRKLQGLIERVDGWGGDAAELYILIDDALSETVGDDIAEWAQLVSKVNGRDDVSNLRREFLRLGSEEGNTGIPKRRRVIASELRRKDLTAQERAAFEAELSALPDAAALKRQKVNAQKRFREWYQKNVDPANDSASYQEIGQALRFLSKTEGVGGRIAEDASAREMITWLKSSLERVETAARKQRASTNWLTQAADPFLDPEKMVIGGRSIGQDLPSMYAGSMRYLADEYQRMIDAVAQQSGVAARAEARAAQAEIPLENLKGKREALLSRGGTSRIAPFVESPEESAALVEARRAHRRWLDLTDSIEYLGAVEREDLNRLIKIFLPYEITGDVDFAITTTARGAKKSLQIDGEVFTRVVQKKAGKEDFVVYERITDPSKIVEGQKYYRRNKNPLRPTLGDNVSQARRVDDAFSVIEGGETLLRSQTYLGAGPIRETADFERFSITPQEFEALFAPDVKQFAARRQSERIALDRRIAEIERDLVKLDPTDAVTASGVRRGVAVPTARRDRIVALRKELADLQSQRTAGAYKFITDEQQLQNVALQKFHGLLQSIKRGEISFEELENGLRMKAASSADRNFNRITNTRKWGERKKFIDGAWEVSSEKKYLDKVRELEMSVESQRFRAALDDTEEALGWVRQMRSKADEQTAVLRRRQQKESMAAAAVVTPSGPFPEGVAEGILNRLDATLKGQYNSVLRFEQLTAQGARATDAMDTILDEVRALRPEGERFLRAAGGDDIDVATKAVREAVERAREIESAKATVGFFSSAIDTIDDLYWRGTERADSIGQRLLYGQRYADQVKSTLDAETAKWAESQAWLVAGAESKVSETAKKIHEAERVLLAAATAYDAATTLKMDFGPWYASVVPMLRRRLEKAEAILARSKNVAELPIGDTAVARAEYLNWVDEAVATLGDVGAGDDVLTRLRTDYINSTQKLLEAEMSVVDAQNALDMFKSGKWGGEVVNEVSKGWTQLTKFGMPSYQARSQVAEIFANVNRMREPEFVRGLNRLIGRYTGFFKAYATASPGFVVRNTMSNTFQLVAAGGDPRYLFEGLGYYQAWRQAVRGTGELAFLESLPAERRALVETAVRAMDAAGSGRGTEAMKLWAPKRKWLSENKWIRTWQNANEVTENSARFMLAYDSVRKGASFDQATAIVKRYLFDYVDVGQADVTMRAIVPFWYWMSRNLPLQMVNRYANPRAYNIYRNAMQNFGADVEEDENVPSWLVESGGIKISDNWFFAPDLGFNRVNQQLNEFKDPQRLLSYVNPILRVPFETLLSDKRFYNDVPFKDRPQQTVGGPAAPALELLAGLLGQQRQLPEGGTGVTDRFNYAAMNMIPPLGQAERLIPATDLYKGRQAGSVLSYLGVPFRQITPEMRDAERRRRVLEQQALRDKASGG